MLRAIKNRIKLYFKLFKVKKVLAGYLGNGLYVYKDNGLKRTKRISFKYPTVHIFSGKKVKKYSACSIVFGPYTQKTVVLFDDIVVSFYKNKNWHKRFKNMEAYLPYCNYPKCEYLVFNDKKGYNIATRVAGQNIENDRETIFDLAKKLLKKFEGCLNKTEIYREHARLKDKLEKIFEDGTSQASTK